MKISENIQEVLKYLQFYSKTLDLTCFHHFQAILSKNLEKKKSKNKFKMFTYKVLVEFFNFSLDEIH